MSSETTSRELEQSDKWHLSQFIEQKLRTALSAMETAPSLEPPLDFVEHLQRIWENDNVPYRRKPKFKLQGLHGETYTVRFSNDVTEYDSHGKEFTFGINSIRQATTTQARRLALSNLLDSVYHEIQHIYTPGSDLEPTTIAETIEYLGNAGEIQAHARQFARRYKDEYPGQPFTVEKMQELADTLKEQGSNKAYNYFVSFADPEKQIKYAQYGDIKKIHEAVVAATAQHYDWIAAQQSHTASNWAEQHPKRTVDKPDGSGWAQDKK